MQKADLLAKRANGGHNDDLMLAIDLFRMLSVLSSVIAVTAQNAQAINPDAKTIEQPSPQTQTSNPQ